MIQVRKYVIIYYTCYKVFYFLITYSLKKVYSWLKHVTILY